MAFYSVVYLSDLKDPRTMKILDHMKEGGDKYVIEDYVPPKRSGSILVNSLVSVAGLLVFVFQFASN